MKKFGVSSLNNQIIPNGTFYKLYQKEIESEHITQNNLNDLFEITENKIENFQNFVIF